MQSLHGSPDGLREQGQGFDNADGVLDADPVAMQRGVAQSQKVLRDLVHQAFGTGGIDVEPLSERWEEDFGPVVDVLEECTSILGQPTSTWGWAKGVATDDDRAKIRVDLPEPLPQELQTFAMSTKYLE